MRNNNQKSRLKISPLRILVIVLSGLLTGLSLYMINASVIAGNSIPLPFGFGAGVVLSGSMEPALSVDDLILVRRADSYFVGDVVVYHGGRMPVVHRIVFADEKTVITQGDANNAPDEPISPSDIDGRVVGSLPKAGVVVAFMRTPTGALLIAGMALLLLWLSFQREQQQSDRQIAEIKAEIERLRSSQQNREPSNESSEDQDL